MTNKKTKVCNGECKRELIICEDNFSKKTKSRDHYNYICKMCNNKTTAKYRIEYKNNNNQLIEHIWTTKSEIAFITSIAKNPGFKEFVTVLKKRELWPNRMNRLKILAHAEHELDKLLEDK